MNLSRNVTIQEFSYSPTAIKKGIHNVMNSTQVNNAIQLCENVFEPIRKYVGKAIEITSGFRCKELNKLIGGASGSQHEKAEAFDLKLTERKLFDWIIKNLEFDQAIYEFGNDAHADWFHISYRKGNNRKQALRAIKIGGKTQYIPYKPL